MKTILEYQKNYWFNNLMITEAFKSKILQEISDQLNDRIKKQKEEAENDKTHYHRSPDTGATFKKLFVWTGISWSDITDDMFKEYSSEDPEAIKLAKRITSNRSNSFPGMIILLNTTDPNSPKYRGVLIGAGAGEHGNDYFSFTNSWSFHRESFKPGEVEVFLTKKFLFADLSEIKKANREKRNQRYSAISGSLNPLNNDNMREYQYERIAKENRERYQKYLAKIKADREANDEYVKKVTEYTQKILQISAELSKNPIKYAKYEYEVDKLLSYLSGRTTWISPHGRGQKGYYSGRNGIITLLETYLKTKLSMAKGNSYDSEKASYESAKKALDETFTKIDAYLPKFDLS